MVFLEKLTFLTLALGLVHMHVGIRADEIISEEEVDLNYGQNYVRVSTPGRNVTSPGVMIHDYSLSQTVYKANGRCFMLDVYNDFPPTLAYWTKMEDMAVDGIVNIDGVDSYTFHSYNLLPFPLNRTNLSPTIQQECPAVIRAVILQETLVQQEAYDYAHGSFGQNNEIVGAVFLPKPTSSMIREKRQTECFKHLCFFKIRR